ncbi:MAG: CBS domain-containing protein, partial [Actinobacteria bacterium]|nr:CBS domain-containing protein [Actinomycetota bacterium]
MKPPSWGFFHALKRGHDVPYLSLMLGKRISDTNGRTVGRLEDVVVAAGARFPLVRGLVARSGRGRNRRRFFIPWPDVEGWSREEFVANQVDETREAEPGDILLARDLLDKQIVDMDGYKIVRVSDIRMARAGDELRVLGADVGVLSILRRLAPGRVIDRMFGFYDGVLSERIVPWNLISPVDPIPYDVRLNIPYREFLAVHPSDIADIIEQLDVGKRAKILALLDDPKAAEVLTHILPGVRSSVAREMGERRLSGLLEIMPPDEAADILGSLPREKAVVLLSLMGIEEASVVTMLLGYDPFTAGGRMTTEFVSIPNSMVADQTVEYLREVGVGAETIYYIYVVDGDGHLSGVLSLRDLLRAAPDEVVGDIMLHDVVTAQVREDQEIVAERLSHYNLLAIPVVDDEHVLRGIVTVDDAIDVMLEEASEDISELSGVPL